YTTGQNDYFGWATDIVGNVAVVGAYAATGGGAVYVYDLPEVVSAFEAGRPALELNVYPNPARDALWVDLPADWQESEFALFSADGRIMRTWKQGHGQPISLQELPTGVYLLKVQFGEAIGLARFRKF
ncbi:MAG: T9SS type A sorting domain-containing protein, partial [Saprospiraceae bacterium]|nr:T9SS type A sorting domain-containing protein [Saprospiraceae bacterium]